MKVLEVNYSLLQKKIWIFLMKVNNTIHLIKVCIVDIKLVYIVN